MSLITLPRIGMKLVQDISTQGDLARVTRTTFAQSFATPSSLMAQSSHLFKRAATSRFFLRVNRCLLSDSFQLRSKSSLTYVVGKSVSSQSNMMIVCDLSLKQY